MKYMEGKDFQKEGYLQEVNRQFLHPLGLALGIVEDEYGITSFVVIDHRDDMEGVAFLPEGPDENKTNMVMHEFKRRVPIREKALGYIVQPVRKD